MSLKKLVAALGLSVGTLGASGCANGPAEPEGEWLDFGNIVRPNSPNTALACDDIYCPTTQSDRAPIKLNASLDDTLKAVQAAIPEVQTTEPLKTGIQARYVAVTAIMRFKDDVDLWLVPISENETQIMIYSRSRVGHSDLGKNASRIEELEQKISEALDAG